MTITREDAVNALRLADEAEQRGRMLRGYQSAAPHLILWGCVYAATYSFSYFLPRQSGLAWLIALPPAFLADVMIARRDRIDGRGWIAVSVLIAAFFTFIAATAAIMQPRDPRQTGAFVPLAVALLYIASGARLGHRMTFAGVTLGGLTLFGYFVLHPWFMLWMAAVGGGTLVLGGLWLRRT